MKKPPKNTASPRDIIGSSSRGDKKIIKKINDKFKMAGVNAGIEKKFLEFKTAEQIEVNDIKNI